MKGPRSHAPPSGALFEQGRCGPIREELFLLKAKVIVITPCLNGLVGPFRILFVSYFRDTDRTVHPHLTVLDNNLNYLQSFKKQFLFNEPFRNFYF